jgi:hypothetical protein
MGATMTRLGAASGMVCLLGSLAVGCGGDATDDGDGGDAGGAGGGVAASGGGGTSGSGGTVESGGTAGTGAAGMPPIGEDFECAVPEDCALDQAGCGCVASPVESATVELPLDCSHDRCSELGVTEADVNCLRGRCSLGIDCDFSHVICESMPPDCAEGMTPSVAGDCWGTCVPVETCTPSAYLWAGDDRGLFAGVWLIGWEGGMLHFSAIRLPPEADGGFEGEVEILADPGLDHNGPYFDCSGVGTFTVGANSTYFMIEPPPDCEGTMGGVELVFGELGDAGGRWGSTLMASVETTPGNAVVGYWFPPETCDATMSRCDFGAP